VHSTKLACQERLDGEIKDATEKLNSAAYYMRARNFQHPQTIELDLTKLHISKAPLLGFLHHCQAEKGISIDQLKRKHIVYVSKSQYGAVGEGSPPPCRRHLDGGA
jgi:hypothetical protein